MLIPKTLRVLSKDYAVEIVPRISGGTAALVDFDNSVIKISYHRNRAEMEHNFNHEVLHVIFRETGVNTKMTKKMEETIVDGISDLNYSISEDTLYKKGVDKLNDKEKKKQYWV
jgi:hypothetical protein